MHTRMAQEQSVMDLLVRSGGLTAAMLQQHCVTAGSGGLDRGAHRVFTLRDERERFISGMSSRLGRSSWCPWPRPARPTTMCEFGPTDLRTRR